MPANDSTEQLIKQIDSYLHDKHRRYAIALEGAWGSGKTRFLEKKVAPHLKTRISTSLESRCSGSRALTTFTNELRWRSSI